MRHTDSKLNHIMNENDFSADSNGGYNYPEYALPVIPSYESPEEYHQNGYQEMFYNENYEQNEMLSNNYVNYPQNQRPFSASSSSCSSVESSEVNQQYNYTNLISFYGHNGQSQNGRPVDNNFSKIMPSPAVQEGYTSVIVDNTQQFHHHGGSVNEFVH